VIVTLHHAIPGFDPLSFKKIVQVVGVATSTCGDIYRHALKNATAKRRQTQSSEGIEEGTGSTCTALTHAGTTPGAPVSDRSRASAALAFFMHWL
jgi:hypothetical protein